MHEDRCSVGVCRDNAEQSENEDNAIEFYQTLSGSDSFLLWPVHLFRSESIRLNLIWIIPAKELVHAYISFLFHPFYDSGMRYRCFGAYISCANGSIAYKTYIVSPVITNNVFLI